MLYLQLRNAEKLQVEMKAGLTLCKFDDWYWLAVLAIHLRWSPKYEDHHLLI